MHNQGKRCCLELVSVLDNICHQIMRPVWTRGDGFFHIAICRLDLMSFSGPGPVSGGAGSSYVLC